MFMGNAGVKAQIFYENKGSIPQEPEVGVVE
jgi:hypothetical protein